MEESPDFISNVFGGSVHMLLKQLSILQLKCDKNSNKVLVFKQSYKTRHVRCLQKLLYRTLFTVLHSPIILPKHDEIGILQTQKDCNIYFELSNDLFKMDVCFFKEEADRLRFLIDILAKKKNKIVDSVLKLLRLLAHPEKLKRNSKQLVYVKDKCLASDKLFQLDNKAVEMNYTGINLFGRIDNQDDATQFDVLRTDIFTSSPNSFSVVNSNPRESAYRKEIQSTLFNGLIYSKTSSLETALMVPKLSHSHDEIFNANDQSLDEGFCESVSSISDSTVQENEIYRSDLCAVLDEAIKLKHKQVLSWEKSHSYNKRLDYQYFTELGNSAFDHLYCSKMRDLERLTGKAVTETKIPKEAVFRDTLNVLIGVQSSSYLFISSNLSLQAAQNVFCSGMSAGALHSLMNKFALIGTYYQQLRKFCTFHADGPQAGQHGGFILKAFIDALNQILQSYWFAVFTASEVKNIMLTELWHLFEPFCKQLKLLAEICLCSEAFQRMEQSMTKPKFPVGPALLSYLYSLAIKNSSTEHYSMLLYLFRCSSKPYINFISDWIFGGKCHDPYREFFVNLDQHYLSFRDKFFWSRGFQMDDAKSAVPLFLGHLANKIFTCGKAINLLKLTNIHHYIFHSSVKPLNLKITFSSKKLEELSEENKTYVAKVTRLESVYQEEKREKIIEKELKWKERIIDLKESNHNALAKIKELEEAIKKTIKDKKETEFKDLERQFQDVLEQQKERRQQKLLEDMEFLRAIDRFEEKNEANRTKAREEILLYYKSLNKKAEEREFRSEWTIRRYGLIQKRKQFFQSETDRLHRQIKEKEDRIHENSLQYSGSESDTENSPTQSSIWENLKKDDTGSSEEQSSGCMANAIWDNINTRSDVINSDSLAVWDDSKSPVPMAQQSTFKADQNISEAKDILYPSNVIQSDEPQIKAAPSNDIERRGLLGNSATEGQAARDILYSRNQEINNIEHLTMQTSIPVEGQEAKDLLYLSNQNISAAKNILYPSNVIQSDELQIKSTMSSDIERRGLLGNSTTEGQTARDILYSRNQEINNIEHFTMQTSIPVEGQETKDLLYPLNTVEEDVNKVDPIPARRDETKDLIYGFQQPPTFQTSRGIPKREGEDMKSMLYPRSTTDSKNIDKAQSSVWKSIDKPFHDDFSNGPDERIRKMHDFEPPSTIKKLLYPQHQLKESQVKKVEDLRAEDVWMDLSVESFQTDFNDIIDQDPHPYQLWDRVQPDIAQFQEVHDENADVIKQLPLETVVKRSLLHPIQTQILVVNKAVVQYFLDDLDIRSHFDAFRKFLLLEDGEFGHSLCSQLFQKIGSGIKPRELCHAIHLNNIIIEALRLSLYASRIEQSNKLSFSLKSMPEHFQPSDVGVLDFLELRYQVPWPCNIVITENSINKYNRVFSFLIRLKRAGWSLQEVWLNLKKAGQSRRGGLSPQLRQLQLFRHEMQHFVNNLERYTVNQIIHVSWEEFQQDLKQQVNDLDDLHRCHATYLKKIIFRSLLSKNAAPVYKLINDIFGMISKFEMRLISHSWEEDGNTGFVTHPMFSKLQHNYKAFRECIEFLFSVISKLVRRGYQDHLADLLLQVNFNTFYSTAVVQHP